MEEDNTLDGRLFRSYFEILKYIYKTHTPLNYEIQNRNSGTYNNSLKEEY